MQAQKWKIEIYIDGLWKQYGQVSTDFVVLYKMCEKICNNGTKARVVRVKED